MSSTHKYIQIILPVATGDISLAARLSELSSVLQNFSRV